MMGDNNYFPEDIIDEEPENEESFGYHYGTGQYPPPYSGIQPPQPADSFAVAALVIGILSLMFAFLSGIGGIFLGALGIIFAVLSRGDERMSAQGRIGAGLSAGGIVLGGLILLALVSVLSSGAFQREFEKELERYGIGSELPDDGGDDDFYRNFMEDGGFEDDLPGV